MKKTKKNSVRMGRSDVILYTIIGIIMTLVCIIILYPLIFVVSSSFSAGTAVSGGKVILWPVEPTLQGYKLVFSYKALWTGYANTIYITVVATTINVILTTMLAYPLSRKKLQGKGFYMTLCVITMFFSGGMVPTYILMSNLGLVGSQWAVILAGAISMYNMIIMRTFFQSSIPDELFEAAKIDGITDIGYLLNIVLPLSKAVFSVIILYYAVGHWNAYFSSMLYLRDRELWPLQMVLRDILIGTSKIDLSQIDDPELLQAMIGTADVMKYSMIVVSSVPVIVAYPFVQKYFEKGVMIGAVKG